jgi:carboxymethylenebutenolidase
MEGACFHAQAPRFFLKANNMEIKVRDGASHAFARHTGTHYDASAAATANTRTRDFFAQHLGASGG